MIWAALAALGVPLWLCAAGITLLIFRNRELRKRPGNIPVRVRRPGKHRWSPGHAVWVHDVFVFRGLPAAWQETLIWPSEVSAARPAAEHEREKLHRIGEKPVIVTLTPAEGETIDVATRSENMLRLLGPFAETKTARAEAAAGAETPSSH